MPTLRTLLHDHDEDVRQIILAKWGFIETSEQSPQVIKSIIQSALDNGIFIEIVQTLPQDVRKGFHAILRSGGRMAWSQFSRAYGDIRMMGAAKRERLHPEREPINVAETLWYSGLIGRAFFDAKPEPSEFAYIPDEIIQLFEPNISSLRSPIGKELILPKGSSIKHASDAILDDMCTLLAGLRMGKEMEEIQPMRTMFTTAQVLLLVRSMGLYSPKKGLNVNAVQDHLTKPRNSALHDVLRHWLSSSIFPEILFMPNLVFEGGLKINQTEIRRRIVDLMKNIPDGTWWDLKSFIQEIKSSYPEVLRVAGDMDAWFVKSHASDEILRGFEHWDDVEGAFLHFFITNILHALGLCDLAVDRKSSEIVGFRWTKWKDLVSQEPAESGSEPTGKLYTLSQGNVIISASCPRSLRYQIARFCIWKGIRRAEYQYQVTPASLQHARQQELQVSQLIGLLKKHLTQEAAPGFYQALQRFDEKGEYAAINNCILLRINDRRIVQTLKNSDLQKYILEELNPTTLIIQRKGIDHLQAKLTELGYLCQIDGEV
ncbi:MAG TPA: hypothetical protein DCK95_12285 [Anaerolineaceae bacterium]|uniref:Helicase XPB/Ssl2 N-terminal domain-containing protein n=1 Tax=Anaerolinea thermophila TaxID=167964 RepID=A0A101FXP3_9CHLR|nr:MAG: hypothetical protein XD73_0785 [Anaerolinea thermophila]HAF63083.1 hypothetical protein [Anaerolineaceae bacterium]